MTIPSVDTTPTQNLSLKAMCNEVESHYHLQIRQANGNIVSYLQKNHRIENCLPAVSELIRIIFYKLRYETRLCLLKEKRILFPLIISATAQDTLQLAQAIDPVRKTHKQILELAQTLRAVMGQYEIQSHHTTEYKALIAEFCTLENNICKWIYVAEDLIFPKVNSDLAKAKFIATVF